MSSINKLIMCLTKPCKYKIAHNNIFVVFFKLTEKKLGVKKCFDNFVLADIIID